VSTAEATRSWLLGAPYRIAFLCGMSMLLLGSAWWVQVVLATGLGHAPPSAIATVEFHGLVMVFGFMPFFFTGFLFTAVPKWLNVRAPSALELGDALGAQVAGWAVFLVAGRSADASFAAALGGAGLAAVSFGATQLWWRLAALVRRSDAPDQVHAWVLVAVGGAGVVALWSAAIGVTAAWHPVVRGATQVGLWLFVGGTFATAAHRLIPFVGAAAMPGLDAWRPHWLLAALLALFCFEGMTAARDAWALPAPAAVEGGRAAIELLGGLGLCVLTVRWALVLRLRIRLVAMLYGGFAWLAASFVATGLARCSGALDSGGPSWDAAPLHLFTMGFLGSTLLAMLTRIICAQTGRAVVADDVLWRLFWLLQGVIVLRLGAAIAAHFGSPLRWPLLAAAAIGWGLLWLVWAARHGPSLWRPRQSGGPA
jgi:uncharacterized protein involved in response to NO